MSGNGDYLKLAEPAGKALKGAILGSSSEDKIAAANSLADSKKRIQELKRNIADLEKLQASNAKNAATKAPPAAPGESRHVAHAKGWLAVATEPDLCRIGGYVVAFNSFATLDQVQCASPDVKAQSTAVYRKGDIFRNVQADAGAHIVSGTSLGSGYVKITEGHDNVKVNCIPVARHDSRCIINCEASGNGGCAGKLVTEKKSIKSGISAKTVPPEVPPGQRTSERLEQLKAAKKRIEENQLDLNALDEYVNFKDTNAALNEAIGTIKGSPGTVGDYAAQVGRGVLGFGKDIVTGVGELAYEGIKAIPKYVRSQLTEGGQALGTLNGQILAENIRLGNVTFGTVGSGVLEIGGAIVKPIVDPWKKGQYVESITRGAAEIGTLPIAWTKAGRAAKAAQAAEALEKANKAAEAAAEIARAAETAKAAAEVAKAAAEAAQAAKAAAEVAQAADAAKAAAEAAQAAKAAAAAAQAAEAAKAAAEAAHAAKAATEAAQAAEAAKAAEEAAQAAEAARAAEKARPARATGNGVHVKATGGGWKNAPNPRKWLRKGGSIVENADGSVTYINKDGVAVRYNAEGYPDFSPHLNHPSGVTEVQIEGMQGDHYWDFKKANENAGLPYGGESPPGYTWHHMENGRTMQLVPRAIHSEFTHAGGVSILGGG